MIQNAISEQPNLYPDGSSSYVDLHGFVEPHQKDVVPKEKTGEKLPWAHIAIGNAKRQLLNSYHNIKPEFLQSYLDEFCYSSTEGILGKPCLEGYWWLPSAIKMNLGINTDNHLLITPLYH